MKATPVEARFWTKVDKSGDCWLWAARVRHNGAIHHAGFHAARDSAEAAVVALRLELFTHNSLDRTASK